jgi:DNA-directed RNA polymerase delta subunit
MNNINSPEEIRLEEISFFSLANNAIEDLPQRSKEIINKRFGLSTGETKTLDSIGKEYKITRERVRQIISDSFRKISKNKKAGAEFERAQYKIILEINAKSGIIKQSEALFKLSGGDPREKNSVSFFVGFLRDIKVAEAKGIIEKAWIVSEDIMGRIKEVDNIARNFLEERKAPISKKELVEKISKKIPSAGKNELEDFLETLSAVSKNIFGHWGLSSWPEIKPKNAKDKIYLILKESGKPLHFSQIAKKIDEHKLSRKKAHPQTIHNELIKDSRFVLIGRGIYALAEWGYSKGTVREVLEKILTDEGSLSKEKILQKISKARKVKAETVMINLNNSKFFIREGNLYKVK